MKEHFTTAIYSILKPLVSLMFHNGMAFGDFSGLVKRAYIEVTEKELIKSGQKATTSRIAISTGLSRKDVAKLRNGTSCSYEQGSQQNRAVRVISAWISDSTFCDEQGEPKALSLQGEEESFETLVSKHSGDMPFKAMLKELLRTKAVELTDTNKVILTRAADIPTDDERGKYELLGEDASFLLSTIKHNIIDNHEMPFYQRKVSYDRIPGELLQPFKELANKENQRLLVKLNKWLAQHDMDLQPSLTSKNPMKVGVGVYYFEEPSTVSGTYNNNEI